MRSASVPTTAAAEVILTTGHPKAALSALSALSIALPAAHSSPYPHALKLGSDLALPLKGSSMGLLLLLLLALA